MRIHNVADYAMEGNYIVYRLVGDEAWFWGGYNELDCAAGVAYEIHGGYIETSKVERA